MSDRLDAFTHEAHRAEYRFGDDTTTVFAPDSLFVRPSPPDAQPEAQDTASFLVSGVDGAVRFEVTASHFSSGNRSANMDRYREIIAFKRGAATCPQIVTGDINTEIDQADELQQLADETGLVVLISSLRIRRLRGLQDQLHKRMHREDDPDSMFMALDPSLVDFQALAGVPHQHVAWPHRPDRLLWRDASADDVAQAWMDDRLLTDHGVLTCPLVGGEVVSLGNAARANYDKYDIKNQAWIDRRTYLEGQQVIETEVARAVKAFVAALPVSATLDAQTKAAVVDQLGRYEAGLAPRYQAAFDAWDEGDDLCTESTPLYQAMQELGVHAKEFVRIVRALSWEDVRDADEARAAFEVALTEALVRGLGVGAPGGAGPLAGHARFDEAGFRAKSRAKIEAAFERIIKRQSAGDLYKMWFPELLHGQTTGGMPIPAAVLQQPTEAYIARRMRELGLEGTLCVMVEALR